MSSEHLHLVVLDVALFETGDERGVDPLSFFTFDLLGGWMVYSSIFSTRSLDHVRSLCRDNLLPGTSYYDRIITDVTRNDSQIARYAYETINRGVAPSQIAVASPDLDRLADLGGMEVVRIQLVRGAEDLETRSSPYVNYFVPSLVRLQNVLADLADPALVVPSQNIKV